MSSSIVIGKHAVRQCLESNDHIEKLYIRQRQKGHDHFTSFIDLAKQKKIQVHPDIKHMTFKDLKVFYGGSELVDTDTLDEKWIVDDCILHAIDNINDHPTWVAKASAEMCRWTNLLNHNLRKPTKNKVEEKKLMPRPPLAFTKPISAVVGDKTQITVLAPELSSMVGDKEKDITVLREGG